MSQVITHPSESDLGTSPTDDKLFEIVGGRRVVKPAMGNFEVVVASLLMEKLAPFARASGLGRAVSEMLFRINPAGDPRRRPDVAFVSFERWPRGRKVNSEDGLEVAPDLAIEVISPSNTAGEVIRKIREYFKAKVRRVWVVYPIDRQVYVYSSPKKLQILGEGDELDGEDVLPGFRLALSELFEDGEV